MAKKFRVHPMHMLSQRAYTVDCPHCGAEKGYFCTTPAFGKVGKKKKIPHKARQAEAARLRTETERKRWKGSSGPSAEERKRLSLRVPRGGGRRHKSDRLVASVECPSCGANPGYYCVTPSGRKTGFHAGRKKESNRRFAAREEQIRQRTRLLRRYRSKKNPSGDNFRFKSKAELVKRIHRYESRVADMLDDLDQWHSPGSGTQLDKTHKALLRAQTELVKAIEAYDPDFSGPVY